MNFFATHKTELIYTAVVIVAVLVLLFVTQWIFRWGSRKLQAAGYSSRRNPLRTIKRILNALWFLLGLSAIALFYIGENGSEVIHHNVKLTIYIAIVLVTTVILSHLSNYLFRENIHKRLRLHEDSTSIKFLRYVALIAIYFVGALFILMAFPSLTGVAQTALGGAGIIAIVAGIASQEALANIIGGFFIIWFKPFKIGDTVRIDDIQGSVTDITLRHTVIRNYDNNRIVIPNSVINQARVTNFDIQDPFVCERIEIGVSYTSDLKLAQKIMREVCEAHPNTIDVRTAEEIENGEPMIRTAITRIDESAIIVRAWAWSANVDNGYGLRFGVLENVKERFDREGIEMPYPYRSIVMRKESEKLGENPNEGSESGRGR